MQKKFYLLLNNNQGPWVADYLHVKPEQLGTAKVQPLPLSKEQQESKTIVRINVPAADKKAGMAVYELPEWFQPKAGTKPRVVAKTLLKETIIETESETTTFKPPSGYKANQYGIPYAPDEMTVALNDIQAVGGHGCQYRVLIDKYRNHELQVLREHDDWYTLGHYSTLAGAKRRIAAEASIRQLAA